MTDTSIYYCPDARRLLKKKVICGIDCPIYDKCPRLILEDAAETAITEAIKAMMKIVAKAGREK